MGDGPFTWWMPGASTGAKVAVFVIIVVVVLVAIVATRHVIQRWRQAHQTEGALDDQEILGPNALKELFFSKPGHVKNGQQDPNSSAFSDGIVWLREEARRKCQSHTQFEAAPSSSTTVEGDTVLEHPTSTRTQPSDMEMSVSHVASTHGTSLQLDDSLSVARRSAFLLDDKRTIRDGEKGCHRITMSAPSRSPLRTVEGGTGCTVYPPHSDHDSASGSSCVGLAAVPSRASSPGETTLTTVPSRHRAEHSAMLGVVGLLCPGEPHVEQRLQAVLQEALYGPPPSVGTSAWPSAVQPGVAIASSEAGSSALISPPQQLVASVGSASAPTSAAPTLSAGLRSAVPTADVQHAAGYATQQSASKTAIMVPWGYGTPTARDILTGARSPRDFATLVHRQQQQLPMVPMTGHVPHVELQQCANPSSSANEPVSALRPPRVPQQSSRLRRPDLDQARVIVASSQLPDAPIPASQHLPALQEVVSSSTKVADSEMNSHPCTPAKAETRDTAALVFATRQSASPIVNIAATMKTSVLPFNAAPSSPVANGQGVNATGTVTSRVQAATSASDASQPGTPPAHPWLTAPARTHSSSDLPVQVSRPGSAEDASATPPHSSVEANSSSGSALNARMSVSQVVKRQSSGGLSSVSSRGYEHARAHDHRPTSSQVQEPSPSSVRLESASTLSDTPLSRGGSLYAGTRGRSSGAQVSAEVFGNPLYGSSLRSTPRASSYGIAPPLSRGSPAASRTSQPGFAAIERVPS